MADEFGRYSPITSEPVLTLEELAKRNKARADAKKRQEEERARREQELRSEAKQQQAAQKRNDDADDRQKGRPKRPRPKPQPVAETPKPIEPDNQQLGRQKPKPVQPQPVKDDGPKTIFLDGKRKPIEQAVAEIPSQMEFEQRVLSGPLRDKALRRRRVEELMEWGEGGAPKLGLSPMMVGGDVKGLSREEAEAIAIREQEGRKAAFESGRKSVDQFGSNSDKELSAFTTSAGASIVGPVADILGFSQYAQETQAAAAGAQAAISGHREETYANPQLAGDVAAVANTGMQMVPGIAAGLVGGPGVGLGVMTAQYGAQAYSEAAYEAAEAGFAGDRQDQYAKTQAGIVMAVMPIFNMIPGMSGLEGRVLGANLGRRVLGHPSIRRALLDGAKNLAKDATAEVVEEVTDSVLGGLAKEKLLNQDVDYKQIVSDTIRQTLMTMVAVTGAQKIASVMKPGDRMTPDPSAPAAGTVPPSTPTADPATQAAQPVQGDIVATLEILNRPAVQEFMNKPQSARTYEAAVKAGMDPIPNPNREGRARYADDLRRRFADPVSQPAAPLEPSAVDRQIIETPSGAVSDGNIVPIGGSREEVIQSPQEQQVQQEGYERAPLNEGRQEELLTTPADSRIPPADHTRESFEKEYTENYIEMNVTPPDSPEYQALESRMADLYDAHPDWAQNLETTQPPPSVVGQTEAGPDQSSPPATGSVSSKAEFEKAYRAAYEEYRKAPRQSEELLRANEKIDALTKLNVDWAQEIEDDNPELVKLWNYKMRPLMPGEVDDSQPDQAATGENQTSPVSSPETTEQAQPESPRANSPEMAYPESAPVVEDWFGKDSERVIEWTKTDSPRTALKPKEYAAAYRNGVRVAAGPVSMVLKNAVDIVSDGKTERFFFGKGGIQLAVGIPRQRDVAATPSDSNQLPATPSDSPVPAFAALPQKSQDLFNKAFDSKDVEQLKQMVDKSNVAWNKEFERRTGVKLPKTLRDRQKAVADWAIENQITPERFAQSVADDALKMSRPFLGEFSTDDANKATFKRMYGKAWGKALRDLFANGKPPQTVVDWINANDSDKLSDKAFKAWKKSQPRPEFPPAGNSLRSVVLSEGGINTASLGDYSMKDMKGDGLLRVMNKDGGVALDKMADILENAGHLRTPSGHSPADWLMEQLKANADSALANYSDKEIEAQLKQEQEQYEQLKETLKTEGIDTGGLEDLRQNSIEAGFNEGDEISDEQAQELIDVSFDFGANVSARAGDIVEFTDLQGKKQTGLVTKVRPDGRVFIEPERRKDNVGRPTSTRYDGMELRQPGEFTKIGTSPFPATLNQFYSKWDGKSEQEITAEFTSLWDSLDADDKGRLAGRLRKFGINAKVNNATDKLAAAVAERLVNSRDIPGKIREVYDIAMEYPNLQGQFENPEVKNQLDEMLMRISATGLTLPPMIRAAMILPEERRNLLHDLAKTQFGEDIADTLFSDVPVYSEDDFKLERPKAPKKKPEDFGTNPNSKQGGLFDAGKPDELPGQNLLFDSDPGDVGNPKTQENRPQTKIAATLKELSKGVKLSVDDDPEFSGWADFKGSVDAALKLPDGRTVAVTVSSIKPETGEVLVHGKDKGNHYENVNVSDLLDSETPPADSQPEPSQEDLMEAILRDELLGEKPAKERKPRAPRTGEPKERKPRKPRSESAKERSDKTAKALKEAEDEFGASFGATLNAGLTAQQMRAAAKLVRAALDHQVSKFNEFAAYVADRFGDEIALRAAEGIELAWRTLRRLPDYAGIDEAGSVSEFINQRNEAKNATGNDGATGREEDQGGSQPDSGDTQDATGPADAEVLGSEPAEDGQTAKKPRGSKRIRGSARGSVRQGNADADSGAGDVTERSGDERGATSSDESGRGTGIDKAPNSTRPNYHLTNPEMIIGGGPKAKFARNQRAIALVRDIEEGNRQPTAEELDTLAGYVGWGAFGQELFNGSWDNPKPKQGWEEEDQWLRVHLGEEEWKSAQDSIVNAHFTDPQTVVAMWDMIRRMGFQGGRVLEPSMGVGNFFSLMPRDLMEKSTLTGIELDKITAKMAKLLHPEANIHQKGYQESQTPDNFYDVIVSNVPFGDYDIPDRRYKQDFSIHNYFFKKAFDQVKPGGVIAFLTSNMTMDGKTQAKLMRAQIANQGELVTAIRLPSGAFQTYAGTKVVADLIVIRKRKPGESPSGDQRWIDVNQISTSAGEDKKIDINEYWQNNPDHILGHMTWGHGTTSGRPGMIVNKPTDLQAALNDAIKFVPENIINTAKSKAEGKERANTTAQRQNSVLAKDNELWSVKGEHLVPLLDSVAWWRKGSKPETIEKNRKEIESLLDVREALRDVLSKQASSQDATEARAALNRTYDAFVKKYGPIGESAAGTHLRKAGDPLGNTLLALEKREQVQGQTKGKGKKPKPVFRYSKRPIFERNTVRQKRNVDNPSLNDAFALERNRSLDIDLERVAAAAKMPLSQVIKTLVDEGRIYKTGNGTYDAADVFLSGNMSRKLRQLEAAQAEGMEDLEKSIEAVRELIPEPVPYSQIEAKLGAPWVSSDDFSNYLGSLLNEPGSAIAIERRVHGWKVTIPTHINNKSEATTLHGHSGIEFSKIASAALNNATVRVTMPDPDDDRKRVTDPEGTAQANAKVSELRENFAVWLWADAERIARLSGVYNEEFNSTVTPKFDDIPLDFEGLVIERGNQPFNLRHHQAAAVWRGIVSGKGIFAHEVGTGKTLTMAALAMESRRLGLYNKPILLAHNANSLAVRNEIQDAYPGANILYVDNLDASRKAATLQAIATEDWDLIVVPHSMAENFMMRPETVEALLKPEMDALEAAALEAFAESEASEYAKGDMPENLDEISKDDLKALKEPTAKELVKERMKLRAMIVKAQQAMADGDGVFFEDMGVDMVMVDEAHIFKKLPITSKQRIKGLNKNASQMGNMLMMMTDYIRTKNNGRGVYLFTGTPITNTVNEIFNMMRFVMAEEMDASGVRGWDGWFNNFATQETMTELSSGGTWENFDRVASFVNLPELRQMAGRYMDIVFADDMVEFKPRPEREGRSDDPKGRPYKQVNNVIINMLDAQRELSDQLKDRYITFRDAEGKEKVRMMREPGGRFNPLVIEGEGVKLAMDPRLVDYGTKIVDDKVVTDESILDPRDPNLKINKMIGNAMTHYNEHPKATQMIFMQVGYTDSVERVVGRNADGTAEKQRFRVFNVAKEIKRRLMEEGVPEDQIAIFSSLSKEKRAEAALKMQEGTIRFAIGSTETMGTGVNAQNELIAMHHLDAPWMPGDLDQRNGRGHRQGNHWNTVNEYRYLTEGPQDGRRWQVLLTKDRFIKEFMRGDSKARSIEMDDVDMSDDGEGTDMEQTFSAAAGDPRIMQRIRLEGQVEKLQRQNDNHARTITDSAKKANELSKSVADREEGIPVLQAMYDTWKSNKTEVPIITLNGKTYEGMKEITDQLQTIKERYEGTVHSAKEIGTYRGLPLVVDNGILYIGPPPGTSSRYNYSAVNTTAYWNLQSLQGIMGNLPERIERNVKQVEKDRQFIDMAKKAVTQQFPKKKQLESKQRRLASLVAEMQANPDVSPAWLRTGAPVGTTVYWKGERYEVAGHRDDDTILYADGDDLKTIPANEATDVDGTRMFPQLPETPADTPDPATQPTEAGSAREPVEPETEPERLRREADQAQQELRQIQAMNEQYNSVIAREWKRSTSGSSLGSSAVVSKEMAAAIAGRALGAIRAGVKRFEVLIRELKAEHPDSAVMAMKPNLIAVWNAMRTRFGLDNASETVFDMAFNADSDADLQRATEAAIAASTPTPDPETPPAATPDPEPLEPDMVEEPERTYSLKNAATDAEREFLGMPPRRPNSGPKWAETAEVAASLAKTDYGRTQVNNLIAELGTRPRATTPTEHFQLLQRYAEVSEKYKESRDERNAAKRIGDAEQEAISEREMLLYESQKTELVRIESSQVSYLLGAGLAARRASITQDFTIEELILDYESAFGRKLDPENNPKDKGILESMRKRIAELEAGREALRQMVADRDAQINDLETRLKEAHDAAVDAASSAPPVSAAKKRAQEKVSERWKAISALLGKSYSIETALAQGTKAFIDLAGAYVELGVTSLGDYLNRVRKRMGPDADPLIPQFTEGYNEYMKSVASSGIDEITGKIDLNDDETIGKAARDLHRMVIQRDGLTASAEDRERAVTAVHTIMATYVEGITPDQVARAMSGIGLYAELNKDEIEVIRRDQKAQLLLLQQIRDWNAGQAPPATGMERPPISDEQRGLRKVVNEAKKAAGIVTRTEGQLRSALDAAKRMVRNRITDLDKALKPNGKPIERSKRVSPTDPELDALRAERDDLQKQYNEVFGKNNLSDEQRLNMVEKLLDRAIDNLEADLKAGKLYAAPKKPAMSSPAIEAKREQLEALKASREEMRIQSGESQQRSDAAFERHLLERGAELARRLAEKNFAPAPKNPERAYTPEMLKQMLANKKIEQEFSKQKKQWEFQNRHPIVKAFVKGPLTAAAIMRKGLTTMEQSLIGRQGWLLGITHPIIYGKSARKAFASNPIEARSMFPTEQDLFNVEKELDADAAMVRLEKIAKLGVTGVHGGLNAEEGNLTVPEWVDKIWGVGGSERAGSAFINTQRRLVFRELVSQLAIKLDADNPASLSTADLKVLANLVNIATGRARFDHVLLEGGLKAATSVFFSPRWWASRLLWLTGQPMWYNARWTMGEGVSTSARTIVMAEWSKQAGAQIAIMGIAIAALQAALGDPGDDEEWDWYWKWNDTNVGRLRIGSTYIDLTAGLAQHVGVIGRISTGKQITRWDGEEDVNSLEVFGNHLRQKLAPVTGIAADWMAERSIGREEFGSTEWMRSKVLPLYYQDIAKTFKQEDPALALAVTAMLFFGMGAQTREPKVNARRDLANELRAMKNQGKSEAVIQKAIDDHLKNAAKLEARQKLRIAETDQKPALEKVVAGDESGELEDAKTKERFDIVTRAAQMLSSENPLDSQKSPEDPGIKAARDLLKAMAPTEAEAIELYNAAYRRNYGSTFERVDGRMRPKRNVIAARRRLRAIYAP